MNPYVIVTLLTAFILTSAQAVNAKEYTVKMVSHAEKGTYAFVPNEITVKSGDTVTWVNAQDDMHNVMSESVPKGVEPFESPMLEKNGQKWSRTFTQSGTYAFHCHPHAAAGMRGTVIVDRPSKPESSQSTGHHHDQNGHGKTMEKK